ncbi:MAG: tetratricopeptide repeat protein [Thermomicrobiales bacterium]
MRTVAMARSLDGAAVLAYSQGDYDEANTTANENLALSQALDDAWETAAALNLQGAIARARGDFDRAAEPFTQALTLF